MTICTPSMDLDDPALAIARDVVDRVLAGHEPYPALAVDRHWTLVAANRALDPLLSGVAPGLLQPPINVLRVSLHPDGLAPRIANLPEWREHVLARLARQIALTADAALSDLRVELESYDLGRRPRDEGRSADGDGKAWRYRCVCAASKASSRSSARPWSSVHPLTSRWPSWRSRPFSCRYRHCTSADSFAGGWQQVSGVAFAFHLWEVFVMSSSTMVSPELASLLVGGLRPRLHLVGPARAAQCERGHAWPHRRFPPTCLRPGARWSRRCGHVAGRWLALLSLGIGFVEILESSALIAVWKWDRRRRAEARRISRLG